MIDWQLKPLVGCGPLRFGMTRAEVSSVLGSPLSESQYSATDFREFRGKGPRNYDAILGYDPDVLTDATFPFQANGVTAFGVNVFDEPPEKLIAVLKNANGGSYAVHGCLFAFQALGLVLSDWLDEDNSDKWIAAGSIEGYKTMVGSNDPDEMVT